MKDSGFWRLGQWGEHEVRRWLERDCRLFVVPTSCIEDGGAPALTRLLQRHVLPDFQAFGDGQGQWWEVKTKRRAVWWQKQQEWRTGIEERHWNEYIKVCNTTGLPGNLVIVTTHYPERMLHAARFADLSPLPHTGSTASYGGKRMVFFRLDDFERIDTPDGPQVAAPPISIEPKVMRPWEHDRTIGDRQPRLPFGGAA